MMKQVIPALIADNQKDLSEMVCSVKDYVSRIQLDFMDGLFVETRSLDFDFRLPETETAFEAHLMVEDPLSWVEQHGHKVDIILPHIEVLKLDEDFNALKKICDDKNLKLGLVLSPQTPAEKAYPYITELNQVLVMTVIPGKYGAKYLPEMLDKIRALRQRYPDLDLEVDGGMTSETAGSAVSAGANLICSGSYIMRNPQPPKAIARLMDALNQ
ncbi:MAG: hypothetical protein GF334_05675 [Candidatus Altiarchaeales archaeon]|nr:hypothetical protein [Candidatus Altiarchaeales archaeon]